MSTINSSNPVSLISPDQLFGNANTKPANGIPATNNNVSGLGTDNVNISVIPSNYLREKKYKYLIHLINYL